MSDVSRRPCADQALAPYDTLYVAFALALGATHIVVADGSFMKAIAFHPDPSLAGVLLPLCAWAKTHGNEG